MSIIGKENSLEARANGNGPAERVSEKGHLESAADEVKTRRVC